MVTFANDPHRNERAAAASEDACRARLDAVGLRPTRQRLALGALLFQYGARHVTAETLHAEAMAADAGVSLATVYNTLRAFTDAGLVRQLVVDGGSVYFDTNTAPHHHFLDEDTGALTDIAAEDVVVTQLPQPPEGSVLTQVDIIVRVKSQPE